MVCHEKHWIVRKSGDALSRKGMAHHENHLEKMAKTRHEKKHPMYGKFMSLQDPHTVQTKWLMSMLMTCRLRQIPIFCIPHLARPAHFEKMAYVFLF